MKMNQLCEEELINNLPPESSATAQTKTITIAKTVAPTETIAVAQTIITTVVSHVDNFRF